jgi:uncharacterized DUF497 family protein
MAEIAFTWDPAKAVANAAKHGITFEEAQTVFSDEAGLLLDDPAHSATEDRFVLLGLSARLRVLVVVHCYREADAVIRLISARRADRLEQATYIRRNS